MLDWLIKFGERQDSTLQFKKKTQIKSNIIKYISSNSILQSNLIEDLLSIKSRVHWGIYGGHHKNTCPLGGSEIKIWKANGGAKEKRMCLKEQ